MTVPEHVGIIVDGNRRWAKIRGWPTLAGHQAGYQRVKELAKWLFAKGVSWASFYFPSQNTPAF